MNISNCGAVQNARLAFAPKGKAAAEKTAGSRPMGAKEEYIIERERWQHSLSRYAKLTIGHFSIFLAEVSLPIVVPSTYFNKMCITATHSLPSDQRPIPMNFAQTKRREACDYSV